MVMILGLFLMYIGGVMSVFTTFFYWSSICGGGFTAGVLNVDIFTVNMLYFFVIIIFCFTGMSWQCILKYSLYVVLCKSCYCVMFCNSWSMGDILYFKIIL